MILSENIYSDIKDEQTKLMIKYGELEGIPPWPVDIDSQESQVWIREFMWRVTEELTEFWEAQSEKQIDKAKEEMVDSLHFLMEIFVFCGFDPDFGSLDYKAAYEEAQDKSFDSLPFQVVYKLGLAANCLKNKRWKQTPRATNLTKFKGFLTESMASLLYLFASIGMTAEDIHSQYLRKNNINHTRIKSKY